MAFENWLSLALLLACLVFAVWRRMNIGVLALAATFILVAVTNTPAETVYKEFPGKIAVLIIGVSLLFAHCERSGMMEWTIRWIFTKAGDRRAILPWVAFVVAAAFSTMGAFSTAPIVLLIPMMAHMAGHFRGSYWVNALAVSIGANLAGLSPLNPTGALVHTIAGEANVSYPTWGLWGIAVASGAIAVIGIQLFERIRSARPHPFVIEAAITDSGASGPANLPYRWASAVALVAFVVLVVAFKADVGFTAMLMAALLHIAFRPPEIELLRRVPWSGVLLLSGLLVYLGLLKEIGTMDHIESLLTSAGTGAALILALAYITAVLCCIESSTLGVISLMMPIAVGSFADSPASFGVISAVAVGGALMVMNPIHVAGTLVVSYSTEAQRPRVFNKLLIVTGALCAAAPAFLSIYPVIAL